jgi:hypothetical protein
MNCSHVAQVNYELNVTRLDGQSNKANSFVLRRFDIDQLGFYKLTTNICISTQVVIIVGLVFPDKFELYNLPL